jgi:hypothetical protein
VAVTSVMLGVSLAGYTKENTPVTFSDHDLSERLDAVKAGEISDRSGSWLE